MSVVVLFIDWVLVLLFWFFFFKQKTAYEMRISDWSSDVCSSDLPCPVVPCRNNGLKRGRSPCAMPFAAWKARLFDSPTTKSSKLWRGWNALTAGSAMGATMISSPVEGTAYAFSAPAPGALRTRHSSTPLFADRTSDVVGTRVCGRFRL